MTQAKDALGSKAEAGVSGESGNVLREDHPRPSLDRGAALAAAPNTDGTYFKVPKVIER
jgi:aspartyl-tRNA(Asn)/glutamyl-tRNA(Gln) amidotransferase subunit C